MLDVAAMESIDTTPIEFDWDSLRKAAQINAVGQWWRERLLALAAST